MQLLFKYIPIIFSAIYLYLKLLNLKPKIKEYLSFSIAFLILLGSSVSLDYLCVYIVIPMLILFSFIIFSNIYNISLYTSLHTVIISYGLTYTLLEISSIMISSFVVILIPSQTKNYLFMQICSCIFQISILYMLFSFKRLKKGMPFIKNKLYSFPCLLISLLILFSSIFLSHNNKNLIYFIPSFLLCLCAIFIFLFWRNHITKTYIDRLKEKDIEDLNHVLTEKLEYIGRLEAENAELAKIIHKDNKLIPAMEYTVATFIKSAQISDTNSDLNLKGQALLENLATISNERKGIIKKQDEKCHSLQPTNLPEIDGLLEYMQQKAISFNIKFDTNISCDVKYLAEHIIDKDSLATLLADLIENAIIATRHNKKHHILLSISIVSKVYTISIFDSGIPFTKAVLTKMGREQITTHSDEEGSGIGMMSTFEILKKYQASLLIDEYDSQNGLYTKKISVAFDNKNQHILYTLKNDEEVTYLNQRSDLLVIKK